MNAILKSTLSLVAALAVGHAAAEVTFYEHNEFQGKAFTTKQKVGDFRQFGFNDRVSSVVVDDKPWEVCEHVDFGGQCFVLAPGRYRSLAEMRLNDRLSSARPIRKDVHYSDDRYAPRPMRAEIAFFEHGNFQGRAFKTDRDVVDFRQAGFNDRTSSVMVVGDRWEACENANFTGRCVILRPGMYPSLASIGLNDRVSSVREMRPGMRVDETRYAPVAQPVFDWRRRPQEQMHEARVTSVRAVFDQPQQRCWVERERVRTEPNVGGAVVGGILGGILGHQIGSGGGRDAATVGGAVVGAVVGANVGRDGTSRQPVQRCTTDAPQGRPDHWDVSYEFRGVEHRVQTTFAPGPTITVNHQGEPRV